MTRRPIQILAAIIVALLLMLTLMRSNDQTAGIGAEQLLLPDFKAAANDITEIAIARHDSALTLRRSGDDWQIVERDGYAADVAKIRQLIIALADARVVEEKTSNPDNYDRLGVDAPSAGGNGAEIKVSGSSATYSVILGSQAQGKFRYARLSDQAQSYLINQNPDVPQAIGDWLASDVIDIGAERIRSVQISHSDGESIVIEKSDQEQTDFQVRDIPADRELSYATVGNGIAGALRDLDLEDVRIAVEAAPTATTDFETWNGIRISALIAQAEEDHWISFMASAVPATETDVNATDGEDNVAESETTSAADEIAAINARLSGWQFKLAENKKNLLIRRWDDILKAVASE